MHTEADQDFTRGLRYLEAARRCERWCGDDLTESRLARLATVYRERGQALMIKMGAPALATGAETPKVRRGVHAAPGGNGL
jgi:hypothetical protein